MCIRDSSFTHSNEVAGMVVLIEELYIRPEYQGKGIGNFVLDWLFQEYQDKVKPVSYTHLHTFFQLELSRNPQFVFRLRVKQSFWIKSHCYKTSLIFSDIPVYSEVL